ncbi:MULTISPECIES: hypothetical protein [Paenibacillus]|nr:hypothetical protein [Paenibacillus odorifer]
MDKPIRIQAYMLQVIFKLVKPIKPGVMGFTTISSIENGTVIE